MSFKKLEFFNLSRILIQSVRKLNTSLFPEFVRRYVLKKDCNKLLYKAVVYNSDT